ncbi:MAG: 3-methylcrotonyl-CoA carboxylase, partial [Pseudomonadota bacterium]
PAPGLTDAWRDAICDTAVRAAEAVGYVGAGTVEFVADADAIAAHAADPDRMPPGGFFFLEMNTRLQVEHPVTEAITGLDLVGLQLDIASGGHLPAQTSIRRHGHAMEARLYAEDPAMGFLPRGGKLTKLCLPPSGDGVRIDAGVETGDTVATEYDPMIAKIITHGSTRESARRRLVSALAAASLEGPADNIAFLARLVDHPRFAAGAVDTGLIARAGSSLTDTPAPRALDLALGATAMAGLLPAPSPLTQWRAWGSGATPITLLQGETIHEVAVTRTPSGVEAETPLGAIRVSLREAADGWEIEQDGIRHRLHLHLSDGLITIADGARRLTLTAHDPAAAAAVAPAGDRVTAPLPGRLISVTVAPGDMVDEGQVVAVIEA